MQLINYNKIFSNDGIIFFIHFELESITIETDNNAKSFDKLLSILLLLGVIVTIESSAM